MTYKVAANYTMPAILNTLKPIANSGTARSANTSTGTSGSAAGNPASGGINTTFLNLLVKELQNQDPTAPMDSTAMVGQMISLNQLDQLISINQKTNTAAAATAGNGAPASAKLAASTAVDAVKAAATGVKGLAGMLPFPAANAITSQLPFINPNASMPFTSSLGHNTAAFPDLLNPAISELNAVTLDFPGFDHISGGK